MTILKMVATRWVVLGLGFSAYWLSVRYLLSDDKGDANVGIGLLAFALLVVAGGIWGLRDGVRLPLAGLVVIVSVMVSFPAITAAAIGSAVASSRHPRPASS